MSAYVASSYSMSASQAPSAVRATFIRRTYMHLALAIVAFAGIEAWLIQTEFATAFLRWIAATPKGWLLVLGGFIVSGWMARGFAARAESPLAQYFGLALYVAVEAVIFIPLIFIAVHFGSPGVLTDAAAMTLALFLGLTFTAFTTQRDFSFLRSFLMIGGMLALGVIVVGVLFGFSLGLFFSAAMIVLAGGAILYDTSNVLHHYPTNMHVSAALELFASVALLFWYVLRLVMAFNRR